jgi:imidazolonepropionase-like amidohydrolase
VLEAKSGASLLPRRRDAGHRRRRTGRYQIRSFHHDEAARFTTFTAEGIAVSTWADWWGFKMEAFDAIPENAALVDEAGARAIIHSDSSVGIQRLNQEAAKAFYDALDAGIVLTEDDAIRWITLNAAWALGVDAETGSIEVGKMADIVVWSGHPFSVYTSADLVFVDGSLEYDRADASEPWSDFELGIWPADEGLPPLTAPVEGPVQ